VVSEDDGVEMMTKVKFMNRVQLLNRLLNTSSEPNFQCDKNKERFQAMHMFLVYITSGKLSLPMKEVII
jgi:hypothetical protein